MTNAYTVKTTLVSNSVNLKIKVRDLTFKYFHLFIYYFNLVKPKRNPAEFEVTPNVLLEKQIFQNM